MDKIKIIAFIAFIFHSNLLFANDFKWKCEGSACTLLATNNFNQTFIISDNISPDMKKNITYKILGDNLGEMTTSCGSPCEYTKIIDFKNESKSDDFFMAQDISIKNGLIISLKKDCLLVSKFFDENKSICIKRDFSPAVILPIRSAKFIANNQMKIEYAQGNNYTIITEDITLPSQLRK